MRFKDRIALVTGGSSGIGLETARLLAEDGARVIINARSQAALDQAAADLPGGVATFAGDMGKLEDIDAMMAMVSANYGGLDILVLCAGTMKAAPLAQVTPELFDAVFDVNVRGAFFCVQKAQPLLRECGSVVLVGSGAAELGRVGRGVYAASKAAIGQLTKSLAAELTHQGVRVNAVAPGPILTPLTIPAGRSREAQAQLLGKMVPIGRPGEPEEVARAIAFLASDEASFIHGTVLPVDGGWVQLHEIPARSAP